MIDRNVFPTAAWKSFEQDWVVVEYDFPRRGQPPVEGVALQRRFGIRAFPTMVVLAPDGSVKGQLVGGYSSPERYIGELAAAAGIEAPEGASAGGLPEWALPAGFIGLLILIAVIGRAVDPRDA